jgi:uncharacterized protein YdcH (DUF465 family)
MNQPERPKRPLNAYFKFRSEKIVQYKDEENRVQKIKSDWNNIDPKVKERMDAEYKSEMEKWKEENAKYEKKYGKGDKGVQP